MGCGIDQQLKEALASEFESFGLTPEQYENEHLEEDVYVYYILYAMTKISLRNAWHISESGPNRQVRKKAKEKRRILEVFSTRLDIRQFFAVNYCTKEELEQWMEAAWLDDPPTALAKRRLRAYAAFVDKSPTDVLEPFPYRKFEAWQEYRKEHQTPKGFFTEGHAQHAPDNHDPDGCAEALLVMGIYAAITAFLFLLLAIGYAIRSFS